MIELTFSEAIYSGEALDVALRTFAEFGEFQRSQRDGYFVVQCSPKGEHSTELVADELANYALGVTIEARTQRLTAAEEA